MSKDKIVSIKYGSEGPKHDPYGFTEYRCEGWIFHSGLMIYLVKEGKRINPEYGVNYDKSCEALEKEFEVFVGKTLEQVEAEYSKNYVEDPMGSIGDYI